MRLEEIIKERQQLKREIEARELRIDHLNEEYRAEMGEDYRGTEDVAGFTVTVNAPKVFDKKAAQAEFDEMFYPEYYEPTFSLAQFRENASKADIARFESAGKVRVTVR